MWQAITTKYLGPTNHHGSRVVAVTGSGIRRVYDWDDAHNVDDNHRLAAQMLAQELEWHGKWVGGSISGQHDYAFVRGDDGFDVQKRG